MLDGIDDEEALDVCDMPGKGLRRLLQEKPYRVVIILGGTNDLGSSKSSSEICGNLKLLVDIALLFVPYVILLLVPPTGNLFIFN